LKNIEPFIWQYCVFVILLVVNKFIVIKTEHTVACDNGSDFTTKVATGYDLTLLTLPFLLVTCLFFFNA
jgi:hypothetical protein